MSSAYQIETDLRLTHAECLLLAKGDKTWGEMADALGVRMQTLWDWRQKNHVPEHQRQAVIDFSRGRIRASDFRLPYRDYRRVRPW